MSHEDVKLDSPRDYSTMKIQLRNKSRLPKDTKALLQNIHMQTTCCNLNCIMCSNPRKFFGELTIQEKMFMQIQD
jgi:MoaA/NifB/PqqE/SkfB family radical SAM enzyme